MANMITVDSEEFRELIGWADRIEQNIAEAIKRMRPTIADEHYMNSEQLADKLHITTRTLQKLRDERTIPFTSVCGKFLYPESGIYEVLRKTTAISRPGSVGSPCSVTCNTPGTIRSEGVIVKRPRYAPFFT